MPEDYSIEPLDFFDWQTRFELESRLMEQNVERYEPVLPERFK